MRLGGKALDRLPAIVARPDYDREQGVGIVHFGIGAFHRAHQAWYTGACLRAGEQGWMIAGVSLRSRGVADKLNPQGGFYTLTERSSEGDDSRVIGAVREVLVADTDRAAIVDRIASPDCHIVSFTVTEKGYCRASDGALDVENAGRGFYPILGDALARRKDEGLPGVTLLSCDNLSRNGRQLGRLMRQWLAARNPELVSWFDSECTTPDSMVDRIVPATTGADLAALEARIGVRDEGAVFTEPFSQWVIEDRFAGPRPRWEDHGAQIVDDVEPYETAKLRMLNGAHSLLAYCGLAAGYDNVHEAIGDPRLRALASRLMRDEAAPTVDAGAGQDLRSYADALIARFENPALHHRLIQIAMDGSQKIPQRWLETLAARKAKAETSPAIMEGLKQWLRHTRGANGPVDDPIAEQMAEVWARQPSDIAAAFFGEGGLIETGWTPDPAEAAALNDAASA